jgi:plastocyanin
VVALLAMALLGLVGCSSSAKPTQPAAGASAGATKQHAHGQGAVPGPPVAPRAGVLDMRIDQLAPTEIDFQWRPGNLLLHPGQTVTLRIANRDYMQHNLVFQAAKVNRNLPVGKLTDIRFTAPPAGTYAFWCKYHLQMMRGTVTVQ